MALLNLETAINKLGIAKAEFGISAAKLALLSEAITALRGATLATALTAPQPTAEEGDADSGTLADATTYSYRIVAVNGNGVSLPGTARTKLTTQANTSIILSWTAVAGATSYRVYGRTGGSELLMGTTTGLTFTDDGSVTPSGALPVADSTVMPAAKLALAKVALNNAIIALDCAHNFGDGSGFPTLGEKHVNEPYHTKTAFENALAALSAT